MKRFVNKCERLHNANDRTKATWRGTKWLYAYLCSGNLNKKQD